MTLLGESMKIKSINPYTEEVNWAYDLFSIGECRARIEKSRAVFSVWNSSSAGEKAQYFKKW
jgi:succinate-semialdehyde dehydrogenase / glutarate-semialdehyde dehydrogenase